MTDEPREPRDAAPGDLPARGPARRWLILFLASLALRLIVAWPVLSAATWPVWDEAGYLERATAFTRIIKSLVAGELAPDTLDAAYGRGVWPPLAPIVFALGLFAGGGGAAGARLVNVLFSALTTPLVEALTRRVSTGPAARAAALCHLAYPAFAGFASLLWSETLFIFLLAAAVLFFLDAARPGATPRRAVRSALAGGLLLGLATLARAAGLPFLAVLPAWLARTAPPRQRLRLAGLALIAALTTLAPWLAVLHAREGRLVAVSTSNGMNLLLGQFPAREGETGTERKVRVHRAAREHARERGLALDQAAGELAEAEIRRDPGAFAARSLGRLSEVWGADRHLSRHVLQAVTRPLPPRLALALWLLLALSFAGLVGLALFGLWAGVGQRGLWLLLAAVGTAPPLLTVASPRMGLPLLALLLPAAGHGWAVSFGARRPRGVSAALLLALALSWWNGWQFRASSSYYGPAQHAWRFLTDQQADRLSPRRVSDRLAFRFEPGGCAEIVLCPGAQAAFADGRGEVTLSAAEPVHRLSMVNLDAALDPPSVAVRCLEPEAERELRPISREGWHTWQSCGIPGCAVYWLGGGEVTPTPFDAPLDEAERNGSSEGS